MLEGQNVVIRSLTPTRESVEFEVEAKIDFIEPEYLDLEGSFTQAIDIRGSLITSFVLEANFSSYFTQDFNGWSFEFTDLAGDRSMRIRNADLLEYSGRNEEILDGDVVAEGNTVFVNLSGDRVPDYSVEFAIQLGFALTGTNGNDMIEGDDGRDQLRGKAGRDRLEGGFGEDSLFGGGGNDILDGGGQRDRIVGGNGSDTFLFKANGSRDLILDFELEEDKISVRTGAESLDDMRIGTRAQGLTLSDEGTTFLLQGLDLTDLGDINITFA